MRESFVNALMSQQHLFEIGLTAEQIHLLADYYDLVREQNETLNLVAPVTGENFAVRHVLESLTLLEFLPRESRIADVGTGAGLPSIPCLLVRPGLTGLLIESKEKKAKFLTSAVEKLCLADRVSIVNRQFEETDPGDCGYVTCRALDKFTAKLPRLVKWSKKRSLLLFGGPSLGEALRAQHVEYTEKTMPLSEQRFLFVSKPR